MAPKVVPRHVESMHGWVTRAVRNNAEWCHAVCTSCGGDSRFDAYAWSSPTRTPRYYPDAVTLVPDPPIRELLSRVELSSGCSIKDSFASIDLSSQGFRELFAAQWIVLPADAPTVARNTPSWELVGSAAARDDWEHALRGEHGPAGVLGSWLLAHDSVAVLAAREHGRIVGGAVLYRGAGVVGLSNVFGAHGVPVSETWSGCVSLAREIFPSDALVGYETGDALLAARGQGFEVAGPLRVWVHGATDRART